VLTFDVPGIPVSGNHRHGLTPEGEIYLTRRARDYSRRIQSIAKAACIEADWKPPDYVRVDLELVNINMDRDNVSKTVNDALQGIVYVDDRRILDGSISRYKDAGTPACVTVIVAPVNGVAYGFGPPRSRASPPHASQKKRSLPAHVSAAIAAAKES